MTYKDNAKQNVFQIYRLNIQEQVSSIRKLKKEKKIISLGRLFTVLAGIAACWLLWPATLSIATVVLLFSIFLIYLIFRDADRTAEIQNCERLIKINEHEITAMEYNLDSSGYEDGQAFSDPSHAYASDLDLFGPHSLFQWLNRCHAEQSKTLLAGYLKNPLPFVNIPDKQSSIIELSENQAYCQRFQSAAMAKPITFKTENKLKYWTSLTETSYQKRIWKWVSNIYPVFPISVLALFLMDRISSTVFVYCLIGFYLVSYLISRKIVREFGFISNIEGELNTLHEQFLLIETEKFKSPFLQSLQNPSGSGDFAPASAAIGNINAILNKIEWRSHMLLNPVLQVFLLWDLRMIILLNEWKKKNRIQVSEWFNLIAEMEVCISLASTANNEPGWSFPETNGRYFHFLAENIGHPLIPGESCITNDFLLDGTGKIALITGSNMAGKSTFLRALGINIVLAGIGAPVCAKKMKLGEMKLISSMRVADNLAENTSTFYAELKKLKFIIESVNRNEPVFILLDEVLRGTNSTDRHKGTRALIRQLLQSGAVAVIATHDTELALSESAENKSVTNFHFDARIVDNELFFDYKIKKGICESLNATALMKKIGIHFQD